MKQISRDCITQDEYAVYTAIKILSGWDKISSPKGEHISMNDIVETTRLSKYAVKKALNRINQKCMNSLLLIIWFPGRHNYYEVIGEVIESDRLINSVKGESK